VADLPSAYPLRDLFDAAVLTAISSSLCRQYQHLAVFHCHALWWLFQRRGWNDRFGDVTKRCVCTICWYRVGKKVRDPRFELVTDAPTDSRFPMPNELDWKGESRRRR
jgi:hypothetical protein